MQFLLKIFFLSTIIKCTVSELQCLSSNRNVDKCQDWKKMSVLVADLVGRSIVNDKVETKSNMVTLLIRAASGVIGHGTNALKTLIVNGLVLLTKTIKSMMDDATDETLPDVLIEQLASGMPCVQLLLCRLSPIIHYMQRRVKESRRGQSQEWVAWNVSDWQQVKGNAKHCSEKHNDCAKMIKLNNSSR